MSDEREGDKKTGSHTDIYVPPSSKGNNKKRQKASGFSRQTMEQNSEGKENREAVQERERKKEKKEI